MMLNVEDLIAHLNKKNSHRDASASFDGIFYQLDLTLLHILEDATDKDAFLETRNEANGRFYFEESEDYLKVYRCDQGNDHIRLAQMKHHKTTAGPAKYEEALLWLYYNYLLFLQSADPALTFRSTIFHFDLSTSAKDVLSILNNAMTKNLGKAIDKQCTAYKLIVDLQMDSVQRRTSFSGVSSFVKTSSMKDIQSTIKSTLKNLFSSYKDYDEELFYAAAISKMKSLADHRDEVSFRIIKDYFQYEQLNINPDYYKLRIAQLLEHTIMIQLSHIQKFKLPPFVDIEEDDETNEILIKYEAICEKIKDFLIEKFQKSEFRKSFLISVCTNTVTKLNFDSGTRAEYDSFLQSSPSISNFVIKLAKIMYYHELQFEEGVKLTDWFIVSEEIWLLKYPGEKRQHGVVLGNVVDDPRGTLQDLFNRFSKLSTRPNVWYLGNCGLKANQRNPYKHDITKVNDTPTPCYKDEGFFYVQCLNCLDTNLYDETGRISNVFDLGCIEKGGN